LDSKIILAILIVALIGVVAATYNNEATEAIQTLTSVATEEDSQDGATDILDSNIGSNSQDSLKIDEDVVKPDTSTKQATNNKASTNQANNINSNQNTNKPATTTNNTAKPNTDNNSNNQQVDTTTPKISSTEAKNIATNNLPNEFSKAVASTPKLYDDSYEVTFYENGEAVGYYEINANSGAITGGAFKGEVPESSN